MSSVFSAISVKQRRSDLQRQLLGSLPGKLRGLVAFGLRALVETPFVSCNANARMAVGRRDAAEMRMYRLLRHPRVATLLMTAVRGCLPLGGSSVLNIDFSNFGGVAVLAAALQTGKGRALPWALEALVSNTQGIHAAKPGYARRRTAYRVWKTETGGDQFDVVLRLVAHIDQNATSAPRLVLDRGFGNKRLLAALFAREGSAYVRFRDDFLVTVDGVESYVRDLPVGDYAVHWRGLSFRLVVVTTGRAKPGPAPWAIVTNDTTSTPKRIARLYYRRFEIEETFRDWKSGLGFRRARFTRWQSLQVLLSFASIATLLAWEVERQTTTARPRSHPKKQLSFFRVWYEALQQTSLRWPAAMTGG